jgi:hypothetical protein
VPEPPQRITGMTLELDKELGTIYINFQNNPIVKGSSKVSQLAKSAPYF